VYLYWGEADEGTVLENWAHTKSLGIMVAGPLSVDVAGLTPNRTYNYRFFAKKPGWRGQLAYRAVFLFLPQARAENAKENKRSISALVLFAFCSVGSLS
jgi:hypothetical protein